MISVNSKSILTADLFPNVLTAYKNISDVNVNTKVRRT